MVATDRNFKIIAKDIYDTDREKDLQEVMSDLIEDIRPQTEIVTDTELVLTLQDNVIYTAGQLSELTILLPDQPYDQGMCTQLNFISYDPKTELNSNDIYYIGADTDNGVFTPDVLRVYSILFYPDGKSMLGLVIGRPYVPEE